MDNNLSNPFHKKDVMMQEFIQWKDMKNGQELEIELYLPFKSEPKEYKEKNKKFTGGYILFIGQDMEKNEIILGLPIKTFTTALHKIPYKTKKNMKENLNALIKFKKFSDRSMTISEMTVMQPTPEQIEKANHFYAVDTQNFEVEEIETSQN